jgi:hypothetical protein
VFWLVIALVLVSVVAMTWWMGRGDQFGGPYAGLGVAERGSMTHAYVNDLDRFTWH